jgi:hypothetical protein
MLLRHDIARLRFELAADLASPRALSEDLTIPCGLLDWCNVLPGLVVARTVAVVHCIEDANARLPCSSHNLRHVGDTIIGLRNILDARP